MKKLITLIAVLGLISTASFAQSRRQQYSQNSHQNQSWSNNGYGNNNSYSNENYGRDRDRDDNNRNSYERDHNSNSRYRGDGDADDRMGNRSYGYSNNYRTRTPLVFRLIFGSGRNSY